MDVSTAGAFARLPACFFSRGPGTFRVAASLHRETRAKLREALGDAAGVAVLRGGQSRCRNDSDHEEIFRQESYFQYLFGVAEPDCWAVIELPSGRCSLFIPRLPQEYAVWMGEIKQPAHFQKQYGVDAVLYVDEMKDTVAQMLRDASSPTAAIHMLKGVNSDSGVDIASVLPCDDAVPEGATVAEASPLFEALATCRVTKTPAELQVMRYASWITSVGHVEVMREVRAGMMEYQLESRFQFHVGFHGGCRHCAYTCICACGPSSAVLHYGHAGAPNDRRLAEDDIALLDMGAEYHCYAADITCSYPVRGRFSADQRSVFNAVLEAQRQILAAMRPGVKWPDMHRLMMRVILTALRDDAGLLQGDVDEMLAAHLGAIFTPHGLGHLIGLDTHDVGGYVGNDAPSRVDEPGICKLRTARVLEEGMVLTVEPGCYFIDPLLDTALAHEEQARFFVAERLEAFRGFGGVRLEDVVAVTADGVDNFTLCPRTVEEVESVMTGGAWPPAEDTAPELRRRWVTLDKSTGTMVPDDRVRTAPVAA